MSTAEELRRIADQIERGQPIGFAESSADSIRQAAAELDRLRAENAKLEHAFADLAKTSRDQAYELGKTQAALRDSVAARASGNPKPRPPGKCPECGSLNIEEHTPTFGEHACRDCGEAHNDKGEIV